MGDIRVYQVTGMLNWLDDAVEHSLHLRELVRARINTPTYASYKSTLSKDAELVVSRKETFLDKSSMREILGGGHTN